MKRRDKSRKGKAQLKGTNCHLRTARESGLQRSAASPDRIPLKGFRGERARPCKRVNGRAHRHGSTHTAHIHESSSIFGVHPLRHDPLCSLTPYATLRLDPLSIPRNSASSQPAAMTVSMLRQIMLFSSVSRMKERVAVVGRRMVSRLIRSGLPKQK